MLRSAFTLIELIFVIVIVAILGVVMAPKLSNDDLQLATDQVIRHIRLAQHLALHEDMYLSESNQSKRYTDIQQQRKASQQWFKQWWRIQFHTNHSYTTYSDHPTETTSQQYGNDPDFSTNPPGSDRFAIDPYSGLFIAAAMTNNAVPESMRLADVHLTDKYGVSVSLNSCAHASGSTTSRHILFDHLGRPHCAISPTGGNAATLNPFRQIMITQRRITITSNSTNESKIICIEPETGFTRECQ